MTDQYTSTNINSPRNPYREIVADGEINLDDFFVAVDSSAAPITLILPDARSIPNWSAYIKALNGAVNSVTIQATSGQTIDGLASIQLIADGESISVFSTGTAWQTGPGGGAAAIGGPEEPVSVTPIVGTFDPLLPVGARLYQFDTGGGPPGLPVTLAPMLPADADLGRRSSLILPFGNPNLDLVLTAAAGQGIADPASFTPVSVLTFPAGTFTGYTVLDFEAVVGGAIPVVYPAVITSVVPDTYVGPPNFGAVSITITGTMAGTLPAAIDLAAGLSLALGGPPAILLAITSATQGGGPGTPWTIVADIPAFALGTIGTLYALEIADTSGGIAPFAALLGAFGDNTPAVPAPPSTISDIWVIESNAFAAGGGRLDEVLVAGPNTNGNDTYVTLEDEVVFSTATAPLADPTVAPTGPGVFNFHPKAARSGVITPGAGYLDIGSAIHDFAPQSGGGSTIWLRWVGDFKRLGPSGPIGIAVVEEIWTYSFSTWSRAETLVSSASGSRFRFNGTGSEIFIQGMQDAVSTFSTKGVVEWSWIVGYTPS